MDARELLQRVNELESFRSGAPLVLVRDVALYLATPDDRPPREPIPADLHARLVALVKFGEGPVYFESADGDAVNAALNALAAPTGVRDDAPPTPVTCPTCPHCGSPNINQAYRYCCRCSRSIDAAPAAAEPVAQQPAHGKLNPPTARDLAFAASGAKLTVRNAQQPEAPPADDLLTKLDAADKGLKVDECWSVHYDDTEGIGLLWGEAGARIRALEAEIAAARQFVRVDISKPEDYAALEAELAASREREVRYESAIRWALGEIDSFPMWPESVTIKGNPKFWWRKELRERAALATPNSATERST